MKKMTKRILTLCTALSVFAGNSIFAFAAVCNPSPDGIHHFDRHYFEYPEYTAKTEVHKYEYGRNHLNQPMYRDCKITYYYQDCIYACQYCGIRNSGTEHVHVRTEHEINH